MWLFFLPSVPTLSLIDAFIDHIFSSFGKAAPDLKETFILHKALALGRPVKLKFIVFLCSRKTAANFQYCGPYSHWYKILWCKPGSKVSRAAGIFHCKYNDLEVLFTTFKSSGGAGSTEINNHFDNKTNRVGSNQWRLLPFWKWLNQVIIVFSPNLLFTVKLNRNLSWPILYCGTVHTNQTQLIMPFSSISGDDGQSYHLLTLPSKRYVSLYEVFT